MMMVVAYTIKMVIVGDGGDADLHAAYWQARYDEAARWETTVQAAADDAHGARVLLRVTCASCAAEKRRQHVARLVGDQHFGLMVIYPAPEAVAIDSYGRLSPTQYRAATGGRLTPRWAGWVLDLPDEVAQRLPPGHPRPPEVVCPRHGPMVADIGALRRAHKTGRSGIQWEPASGDAGAKQ